MIPPVKSFSNISDLFLKPTSTIIPRSSSTTRLYIEGTNQELWNDLEKKLGELKNLELKKTKTRSLDGIDRFIGIGSNPTGRAIVEIGTTVIRSRKNMGIEPKLLDMNANFIGFDGYDIAIAAQYPTNKSSNIKPINMDQELCRHVRMLLNNKTAALVILVSQDELKMNKKDMLPYFSENSNYDGGKMQVYIKSLKEGTIGHGKDKLAIASYDMNIIDDRSPPAMRYRVNHHGGTFPHPNTYTLRHHLPVIHVKNAPGRKGTFTVEQLKSLVNLINEKTHNRIINGDALPVIVDTSGTGPAAQLIIAKHILDQANTERTLTDHVAQMVQEVREQRNSHMIETQKQFDTLLDLLRTSRP